MTSYQWLLQESDQDCRGGDGFYIYVRISCLGIFFMGLVEGRWSARNVMRIAFENAPIKTSGGFGSKQ